MELPVVKCDEFDQEHATQANNLQKQYQVKAKFSIFSSYVTVTTVYICDILSNTVFVTEYGLNRSLIYKIA